MARTPAPKPATATKPQTYEYDVEDKQGIHKPEKLAAFLTERAEAGWELFWIREPRVIFRRLKG